MIKTNKYNTSISNRLQIVRRFKRPMLKYLIYIVVIYTFTAIEYTLSATISHGTYYVIYVSDGFVTASIDSRMTIIDNISRVHSYKDDVCKIFLLGADAVLLVDGVIHSDLADGLAFDSYNIAQREYDTSTNPVDIYQIATRWADIMAKNITMIYPLYALEINDRPDGEISHGYFIRNEGNKVSAVKAIVQMEGPKISPIFTPIVTFIKSNSLILSGHREILAEFAENGESDRAKAIGAETMGRVSGNPDPQIWAAKTEMYVKAVRDWSGDVGIGGDIATIIVESGKKRSWFHRPSFCPEN